MIIIASLSCIEFEGGKARFEGVGVVDGWSRV